MAGAKFLGAGGLGSSELTCVADTSVVDLNAHLMSLRGSDLNVFNAQLLASLPGDSGLAGNSLTRSNCQ